MVGDGAVIEALSILGDGVAVEAGVAASGRLFPRRRESDVRTLVTGGAGFIGSNLVDRLLAEGHSVDVVDDLSTGSLANLAEARSTADHQLTFHQLDVRSPDVVELIARRRPEVVFHLAAQADVRVSVARPVFDAEVNIIGQPPGHRGRPGRRRGQGGVRLQRGHHLRRSRPVAPADQGVPPPATAVALRGGQEGRWATTCYAYRELHNLEYTALALANVYGPRQDPHGEAGVVAIFAGRLLAGEPCTIFGDGGQTRDFVYVDDVVDAFARAADRGRRAGHQHRHRPGDVGQRAVRHHGPAGRRRPSRAGYAPARPG